MRTRSGPLWSAADSAVLRVTLVVGLGITALGCVLALAWTTPLLPADAAGPLNTITLPLPGGVTTADGVAVDASEGVTADTTGTVELTFHDPTVPERLLLVLPALLGLTAAFVVILMLLGVVTSLRRGDPFVPANARRLHTVALVVVTASVLVPVAGAVRDLVLQSRALGAAETVLPVSVAGGEGISLPLIGAGCVIAALAEVFRRGTGLRDDVEGLV